MSRVAKMTAKALVASAYKKRVSSRSEFAVRFTRTVDMHYTAEVWARDEAEAISLAKEESNNHPWVEGVLVDEKQPSVRRLP